MPHVVTRPPSKALSGGGLRVVRHHGRGAAHGISLALALCCYEGRAVGSAALYQRSRPPSLDSALVGPCRNLYDLQQSIFVELRS